MSRYIRLILVISVLLTTPVSTDLLTAQEPTSDQSEDVIVPEMPLLVSPLRTGRSPFAPPEANDKQFMVDTGAYLDRYLFRKDVPNGRLPFEITIDRYYSPLITSVEAPSGFLSDSLRQKLIEKRILPERATLTLMVFDVDHDYTGSCAEVDYVFVNGQQVANPDGNGWARLSSGNGTWSSWSVSIPIQMLKFPTSKGVNGQRPTHAINRIEVEIDVNCKTSWAVEVDWAHISISTNIRPVIFAHGWRGDTSTFSQFRGYMTADGIPYADEVDLLRGIQPILKTSPILISAVDVATREFGVDRVILFAHSKGGLVSRHALGTGSLTSKRTDALFTFGTPHHGVTSWLGNFAFVKCWEFPSGSQRDACNAAAEELGADRIRDEFNYQGCKKGLWPWQGWTNCEPRSTTTSQTNVKYYTFVGDSELIVDDLTGTYPWLANQRPFPSKPKVDHVFTGYDHGKIHSERNAYECAMSYIESSLYSRDKCPSNSMQTEHTEVTSASSMQLVASNSGSLASNGQVQHTALLDSGTKALFSVISAETLEYRLSAPDGRIIDPVIAASDPAVDYFAFQQEGAYWHQYQVTSPMVGSWLNLLRAGTATSYGLEVSIESLNVLSARTVKHTYQPGEVITAEVGLSNSTAPILGAAFIGQFSVPGSSPVALTFLDNGLQGDAIAGDGIATAQIVAPAIESAGIISVTATQGNTVRLASLPIVVAPQTAALIGVVSETVSDTNGNGLYDALRLGVQLNVTRSGHFELGGQLVDSTGQLVATAAYSSRASGGTPLPSGAQTIGLVFDGRAIRQSGRSGPYRLVNVQLTDQTTVTAEADHSLQLYTTSTTYPASTFEGERILLSSAADQARDLNGDGKYDDLRIQLSLNVATPGNFSWNARLVGARETEITWIVGSGYIDNQTPMMFTIDGRKIAASLRDGPYVLRDVSVVQTSGGNATALIDVAHTTAAYKAWQFTGYQAKVYLPLIRR
jgi:hypothetical protein